MVDPSINPYYQRLLQNPDDAEALFVLWQWYGDRHEFQQLATFVEQIASRRLDPGSAADLFYRAGELWAKNVGRVDKAVGNYRRAFELDPRQVPAVEAARNIYLQLNNYKLAAQLYERQLGLTAEPGARLELLRGLAAVRAQMSDPSGQAAALEEVIRITPDDLEAMRELAAAYIARAEAPGGSDDDRIRAATLLATIAHGLGGEHTLPFAEYALDTWAGEPDAFARVREAYIAEGRTADLAARAIQFVTANPDSEIAPAVRVELAQIYEENGQYDDAIVALVPLADHDEAVARRLCELYRHAGHRTELVRLLRALPPAGDPGQRMADLREIAEIQGQQSDREGMLAALREVLGIDPTDAEALALVEDDLRAHNAFDDLRGVLWAAARAPNAGQDFKRSKLREIALLSEQRMGDAPAAIDAWRALLAVAPEDEEASTALEKLYTRTERWEDLARWIEKRASNESDPAKRRAQLERLVDVHQAHGEDGEGVAQALRMLWEHAPDDEAVAQRYLEAARAIGDQAAVTDVLRTRASDGSDRIESWSDLATHLEQISERDEALQTWQHITTLDGADGTAWDAIERLLEATGRHDMLLETLIAHAEGPAAGDRVGELAARAADVARMLGDVATATAQARRALEHAPADEARAVLLMDLYEAASERDALLALLRDRASRAEDGPAKIALLRRLAHTLGQTDAEASASAWRELREVSRRTEAGDDAEALDALCGFAEVAGDPAALADLLREAAAAASEPAARVQILRRRADILADELDRPDEALATLREIDAGDDATTWARLAEIAQRVGNHAVLAEALEKQLPHVEDDEARAKLAEQLVAVCDAHLADPARTIAALESWLDADPTEYAVVGRLATLYEQAGRWAEVVKYREVLAEVEEDPAELSEMVQRVADLAEHRLGDARKAYAILEPVAKDGDIGALEALRGVAERGRLEGELVSLLGDLAGRVGNPADRADLWLEIARRRERALDDPAGALDARVRALVARPADLGPLDEIERLVRQLDQPAIASQAYAAVVSASDDPAVIRAVALRGVAFFEAIEQTDAALDLALGAQGRAASDDALLEAIIRLAPRARRGDEMFIAFDRRRGASRDDDERYGLLLRAAESAAIGLEDRDTAVSYARLALGQAMAGRTPDDDRLARLERVATDVDARAPAIELTRALADAYTEVAHESLEDSPRLAATLLRHAGDLHANALGDNPTALELVSRAVATWPDDPAGPSRLEELADPQGRLGDVVDLYQRIIDDAYEPQTARAYQSRRATLLGERLDRIDEAIDALRALVEIAPRETEPVQLLQGLLRRAGRHQDLLMALERELEIGSPKRLDVLREIATIWQDDLRNTFEARDAWKRVQREAPDDEAAREALERLARRVVRDEPTDERNLAALAPPAVIEVERIASDDIEDADSRERTAPPSDTTAADEAVDEIDALEEPDEAPAADAAAREATPEGTGSGRDEAVEATMEAPGDGPVDDPLGEDEATTLGSIDALRAQFPELAALGRGEPVPSAPPDPMQMLEAMEEAEALDPDDAEPVSSENLPLLADSIGLENTSLDALARMANRPAEPHGTDPALRPPPPRKD